jgi:hypothetical protein
MASLTMSASRASGVAVGFSRVVDWRDEKSMVRWRATGVHHVAQKQGRAEILEDYHLRIGGVIADTDAPGWALVSEQRFDETEVGAKVCNGDRDCIGK